MLEEEKCSADSDRSTVYTILRENNTVGADEIGISSIPAMKIADMGVHLGPIPLGPAVRGDLSLRRRSAAAADYPDTVVGMVHENKEEVLVVQVGKKDGNHRKVASRRQSVVVSKGWYGVLLHTGNIGWSASTMPISDNIVGDVPHRTVVLACPAVVEI